MKHTLLVSAAALALTAASTVAFSQSGGNSSGGAAGAGAGAGGGTGAPMANPATPPGGGAAGGSATGGKTGAPSSSVNPTGDSQSTINETQPPGAHKGAQDTTRGQNQKSSQQAPAEKSKTQQSQGEQPRGERREQSQTEQRGGGKQQSQTEHNGGSKQGTAERPMTSKNVSLTTEQKTTIRTKVLTANAPRITGHVDFDIKVGVVVPRTVRVAPLPVTIVEIEPDWRGYMYFVSGDEIIVVEPGSLRIVAVLDV